MHAGSTLRLATLAMVFSVWGSSSAMAGWHGGAVVRPGFRAGMGGYRGGGAWRGIPPVAGVIHERPGMRPTYSAYGHTQTGFAPAAFGWSRGARPGFAGYGAGYGHVDTASRARRPVYAAPFGGHGYGFRGAPKRLAERSGEARRRFRFARYAVGSGGGYGDDIGGYDGAGVPGFAGAGTYGGQGTYGNPGTYGGQGASGRQGVYAGQGTYGGRGPYGGGADEGSGGGQGFTYRSETPLAARFAEPPLAPSPSAPAGYGDRYADELSDDVEPGPRSGAPGCGCGEPRHRAPHFDRYGVGTAY